LALGEGGGSEPTKRQGVGKLSKRGVREGREEGREKGGKTEERVSGPVWKQGSCHPGENKEIAKKGRGNFTRLTGVMWGENTETNLESYRV